MALYTHRHRSAAPPPPRYEYDCSILAGDETVFLLPRDHGRRFDHHRHHYAAIRRNSPWNQIQFDGRFVRQFLGEIDETVVLDFPQRSAAEEAIAEHIRGRIVRDRGGVDGGICVVCQDDLVGGINAIARLDCGHNYHQNCIQKWLNLNNTCPLCKATVIAS